jgi:hypothetical protein
MNHLSKFAFFILFSFSFSTQGKAQSLFAGYDDFCNLPVIVEPNRQDAEATYRNGSRVIILDPGVMGNWTLSRIFTLAHECAHHGLGHVSLTGIYARAHLNATRDQELSADCWAAKSLAEFGYYEEIERSIDDMSSMGHIAQGTYPSGKDRARVIARCAGISFSSLDVETSEDSISDGDNCRNRIFTHNPCD